jgi:hypothetical protein
VRDEYFDNIPGGIEAPLVAVPKVEPASYSRRLDATGVNTVGLRIVEPYPTDGFDEVGYLDL